MVWVLGIWTGVALGNNSSPDTQIKLRKFKTSEAAWWESSEFRTKMESCKGLSFSSTDFLGDKSEWCRCFGNELSAVDPTAVAIGFHHSAKLPSGMDHRHSQNWFFLKKSCLPSPLFKLWKDILLLSDQYLNNKNSDIRLASSLILATCSLA